MVLKKLKRQRSPGIAQIQAELFKAGSRTLNSEFHKFIHSSWNKEELPEEWKESIIAPILRSVIKQVVVII